MIDLSLIRDVYDECEFCQETDCVCCWCDNPACEYFHPEDHFILEDG